MVQQIGYLVDLIVGIDRHNRDAQRV